MGFWDMAGKIGKGALNIAIDVAKELPAAAMKQSGRQAEHLKSNNNLTCGASALGRGRMNETDQIRGPDSPLPNEPGVYRHINKSTGEVEYVGQTNDLRVRQQQHASNGKLDTEKQYIQYGKAKSTASKDDLCQTEVDHITRHKPSGNTTKGGNGRR
jgi:hypothetical protein